MDICNSRQTAPNSRNLVLFVGFRSHLTATPIKATYKLVLVKKNLGRNALEHISFTLGIQLIL